MLKITFLIFGLCAGVLFAAPSVDEITAKNFIVESSDKYSELYNEAAQSSFDILEVISNIESEEESKETTENKETYEVSDSSEEMTSSEMEGFFAFFFLLAQIGRLSQLSENMTSLSDEAYRFPIDQFKDEEVKIGIQKLKYLPGFIALKEDHDTWSEDDFSDYLSKKNYCKYKDSKKECDSKYNEFAKVLKTSTKPDEILFTWKELREKNAEEAKDKMHKLIELYKKLAEKYQKSPKFTLFAEYLDEHFVDEMEDVMKHLKPLFVEIHAYIRDALHKQYGDIVPVDGLIPHHLYEQAHAQAWKPKSFIAKDFAGVKMPIKNNFNMTAEEVMEIASHFMLSLGLDELDKEFWEKRVKEDDDKGDSCKAEVFDSGNKFFFRYCKEVNIKRFLQMHGYIARIYYANEKKHLPFAYTDPYDLQFATGEAVILSATTPKYLHKIGKKDVDVLSEQEDMNRLFRMGVHTLLSVPDYFVNVKVLADVLDEKVPLEKMNEHYWELMKEYAGVAPPEHRSADAFDLPPKFYIDIENNLQTKKFISEIVGYQVYEALCKKSGQFVDGDNSHSLHNCNFYESKEAGTALKDMMSLGATKSWKEVLGTLTGDENGMKADSMLEYFEPLKLWLEEKNKEHGITVGWEH